MIRTASLKGSPSIQWLYTLRADFAGQAYRHPAFVEALRDGEEKLADMNATELRQSIVEPARKLEVDFKAGKEGGPSVSERIADAVEARPGSLPLMAHLLEKLWEKRERRQITHDAYDGLGGLEGALDRHADEVYERLTDEQKLRARRLLSRLVKIEEGNEPSRRVRTREELGEELWQVAGLLADADSRLLVIRGTGEAMQEAVEAENTAAQARRQTVEVAHEALLRNWGRFRGWLNEDLAFLLWRQRLELRLEEYRESGIHLSGAPLQTAISWLETRKHEPTEPELNFIQASISEKVRIEGERKAQDDKLKEQQPEIIAQQQETAGKQRLLIYTLCALAVILIGAFLGGIYLNKQTNDALRAQDEATLAAEEALVKAEAERKKAETAKDEAERDAARYAAAIASGLLDNAKPIQALLVVRERLPRKYTPDLLNNRREALVELHRSIATFDGLLGQLRATKELSTTPPSRPTAAPLSPPLTTTPLDCGT